MDPRKNPYTPGAGTPPLELAGRERIIEDADIALDRIAAGRPGRPMILLGLRGVGKTVLLNKIYTLAEDKGFLTVKIEAPEGGELAQRAFPDLKRILIRLSSTENIRDKLRIAGAAMRNFAAMFKVSYEGIDFGASPADSVADSGVLERDFSELMRAITEAAGQAGRPIAFFVDEIQYLSAQELGALAVTCHEVAQRQLPFILFGAGLPQIAALAGDAKSYAERLFHFPQVGPLPEDAARRAISAPAQAEGVEVTADAQAQIMTRTQNYPYFIQEWGSFLWNHATASPITRDDVVGAEDAVIAHLDANFFRVRFDRCKPVQQKYLRAMAELGPGSHKTGEIAAALGCEPSQLAATRAQLISIGMIWSQRHGETAFTVPLFDEFMKRQIPVLEPHIPKRKV
ncbi:AAA family ATPase [Paracoccus sp. p3-h83]|uniref:AAA family ATPase n=1 Tax=Paracoccus sp. p3-h83 TaxID=3342805 RepID=UPI0035B87F9B